ncbi:MAG: hypothetical protein IT186_21400 [Acidobacteria bacterium]|nr:hypothetical protein [Acidobacteriota bacterium]
MTTTRIDHDTAYAALMAAQLGGLIGYHYEGVGFEATDLAHALAATCADEDELNYAVGVLSNGWFPDGVWPSNAECLAAVHARRETDYED